MTKKSKLPAVKNEAIDIEASLQKFNEQLPAGQTAIIVNDEQKEIYKKYILDKIDSEIKRVAAIPKNIFQKWDGKENDELIERRKEIEADLSETIKSFHTKAKHLKETILKELVKFKNNYLVEKKMDKFPSNFRRKTLKELRKLHEFIECATDENISSVKFTGKGSVEITNDFMKKHIVKIICNDSEIKQWIENWKSEFGKRNHSLKLNSTSVLNETVHKLYKIINTDIQIKNEYESSNKKHELVAALLNCSGIKTQKTNSEWTSSAIKKILKGNNN